MMVKVTHADEALYLQVMEPRDGRAVSTRGEGRPLPPGRVIQAIRHSERGHARQGCGTGT